MNFTVLIDWRFAVALGIAVGASVLAVRMDSSAAERVSIHAINACKGYVEAVKGVH